MDPKDFLSHWSFATSFIKGDIVWLGEWGGKSPNEKPVLGVITALLEDDAAEVLFWSDGNVFERPIYYKTQNLVLIGNVDAIMERIG